MSVKIENKERFIRVPNESLGLGNIDTVKDMETGITYIMTMTPKGVAMVPLFDEDGKVKIDRD